MNDYEIRAVVKINLDSVREKDIIDEIEELVAHRKLGTYITNLLKFAAEHREDLNDLGFDKSCRGMMDTRKQMYKELGDNIRELKHKVDGIFEMTAGLKAAFEMGHVTGLETQVDNLIAAQIVCQNQLNKIKRTLGEEPALFKGAGGVLNATEVDVIAKEASEVALAHYGNEISKLAEAYNNLKIDMLNNQLASEGSGRVYNEENLRVANTGYQSAAAMSSSESTDTAQENEENKNEDEEFAPDMPALQGFFGLS